MRGHTAKTSDTALAILLAEDTAEMAEPIVDLLRGAGHHVAAVADGAAAMAQLDEHVFDLVITDVRLPKIDGLTIFRRLRQQSPGTDVVIITAFGTVSDAVAAMKDEAFDYLSKPFELGQLTRVVERVAERRRLRAELQAARAQLASLNPLHELIGQSPPMSRLRDRISAIADSDAAVLVTGESGTGKELVARSIHAASPRRDRAFVAINCAAFPEQLIESELFGHVRGSFTGAVRDRQGRFAAADGGTLFLDEITEMAHEVQAKLLRVLQSGTFEPVGSNTSQRVNVRVISASNRDAKTAISAGTFREDLYYRIKVLEVHVPALRHRLADLPLLVEHFVRRYTPAGKAPPEMTPRAWAVLRHYEFPGNVRELEHAVQHAVVLARGSAIGVHHLPDDVRGPDADEAPDDGAAAPLAAAMARFEQEYITRVVTQTAGNRTRAAEILGISRKSLWRKLKDYGVGDVEAAEPVEAES